MDDTVKAATDALYEAIKAKVLKDLEECKVKAQAEYIIQRDKYLDRDRKAIDKFVTTTFVRDPTAPDISVRAMIMLWEKWCEQDNERCQYLLLTNAIQHISAHPWVQRQLYQDFKGLALGGWLAPQEPPQPYNPNDILRPMPLVLPAPQPTTKPRGRPKKTNI